jgi:hypothetical protein
MNQTEPKAHALKSQRIGSVRLGLAPQQQQHEWIVIPIIPYGIGLLKSDGLLIMVCHAITLTQVVLGVALWRIVVRGFADA